MNEMTTSDGKPAIKKADFNENGRKALGQTYINSPKTESGGNGGNDNLPPNKIAGDCESYKKRENFETIPLTSDSAYKFHYEIKEIINAIHTKPEETGFFAKIKNNVANSVRNITHDIQTGLLGPSFNVYFNRGKEVHPNHSYADLMSQVAKLRELLGGVNNQQKQVISDRILKLEKNIKNTANTIENLAKVNGTIADKIAPQLEYGQYDEATASIAKIQQNGIKAATFFGLGVLTGGASNLLGAVLGFGSRVAYAGYAGRKDVERLKTAEYRNEEIEKASPDLINHLNTIKQQVLEGKFSESGIKELLGSLQDLIVLQEGKLPPKVQEQMLDLSSVLYKFLGENSKPISEPEAIDTSNNFKSFIDNLRIAIDPEISNQVVRDLYKSELDQATKKALTIGAVVSALPIAGGFVWRNMMDNAGIDPHQVVTDLTSKLSKGPIAINGDHGNIEGAILATHETTSPDSVAKLNELLGTHHQNIGEFQTKQIGEITIFSDKLNGITDKEFQDSITRAAVPNDAFAPENTIEHSEHIDLIKANEVHGDTLTFRHDGNEITIGPGDSRNILNNDLDGFSTVVGKDADGNLVTADLTKMDAAELAELRKIMEEPGARYFAEQTEQIQQANIKDFFGIGDTQGLGGEALRKQAVASVGSSDPVATTKEMFRIRAEANIGGGNAEAFANAQMQALEESAGGNYEQFVNAAARGEQIKVDSGLTRSVYQKLLDQFPQYKTFITEQARWTNVGDGLPFQSVQGISTETAGISEQNTPGFGPFGWLNDRSDDLSNIFTNMPVIPDWAKETLVKAAPGMVYGGAAGGAIGGLSGIVKGFRTSGPGFGAKAGGVFRGLGAGFTRGALVGGLTGGVAGGGFGASKEVAGLFGLGASLGTKTWTGALWNAGNNPMERLIGATPARPAQVPANATPNQPAAQNTPATPEGQREINDAEYDRISREYLSIRNVFSETDGNGRDVCHGINLPSIAEVREAQATLTRLQREFIANPNLRFNITGDRNRQWMETIRRLSLGQETPFIADPNNPSRFDNLTIQEVLEVLASQQEREALQRQNQQGGGEGEGGNEGRELTEATFGRFAQQMRDYRNTLQPRLENVTTRERLLANDVERRRVVGELNQHLNTTRRYANAIRDRRLNLNDANERTLQGINRWTREALTTLDYEPRINRITALINSNGERDQDNVDDNLERIVGAMLEVQEELNRNVERGIRVEQSELLLEDIENNIQALRDRFGDHDIDDIIDEIEVGGIGVPDAA